MLVSMVRDSFGLKQIKHFKKKLGNDKNFNMVRTTIKLKVNKFTKM